MFINRIDAGEKLAAKLGFYRRRVNGVVVGLPRGGVPVAYRIAQKLHLPLDVVCPRKIGAPSNKEFAIGAITESGIGLFDRKTIEQLGISEDYIRQEVEKEKRIAEQRISIYRKGRPPRNFNQKCVLLVDDGLATGATMKAAIESIRLEQPEEIVVAVPVSPPDTLQEIAVLADQVVCLQAPAFFQAVGQFYQDFSPTEDDEVISLMRACAPK